jgi:hypothetical protein
MDSSGCDLAQPSVFDVVTKYNDGGAARIRRYPHISSCRAAWTGRRLAHRTRRNCDFSVIPRPRRAIGDKATIELTPTDGIARRSLDSSRSILGSPLSNSSRWRRRRARVWLAANVLPLEAPPNVSWRRRRPIHGLPIKSILMPARGASLWSDATWPSGRCSGEHNVPIRAL